MIRPTRRAVLLLIAGIPPALLVVIAAPELWTVSLYYGLLLLFAMAGDALLAFPARALQVDVQAPKRIYIGDQEPLLLAFKPTSYRRIVHLQLLLELRGYLARPEITSIGLDPRKGAGITIPLTPSRRGLIHVDRIWFRWKGPFSLVEFTHLRDAASEIEVVPNIRGARKDILQFSAHEAIFGEKIQEKGEGAEFDALREYLPGHDNRFIDWKHSAKHRKLLSKEFRAERNHQVILAFDTGYLMMEPLAGIARLDHVINAALPLAWIGLQSGDLVGTFGFDATVRHYQAPLRGRNAFGRIQRSTAELDYHHDETNFTLGLAELTARLRRRALVILFTEFVDTITSELLIESLQRVAQRHAIIFVTLKDPYLQDTAGAPPTTFSAAASAVVAQDFLNERSIVLERLARLGIHCLDVPNRGLSVRLINRYLQIKQRGLI